MKNLLGIKNINSHSELDSESINLMDNKELALIDSGSESGMTRGRDKCIITPPEFLSSQSSLRNSALPVQGGRFVKAGFTLAEVLITLGIIGVVAAMTIPNLITGYQKKATVTKLQKAISTLNQAYKLSYDEFGEPSISEIYAMGGKEYFNTYYAPFIKVHTYCDTYSLCGYESYGPFKNVDGTASLTAVVANKRSTFLTPDGYTYIFFTDGGTADGGSVPLDWVMVDINGGEKPNILGRDVFYLQRKEEKGILPIGFDKTDAYVKNNCTRTTATTCAERIKRAGWQIDKSYPWK